MSQLIDLDEVLTPDRKVILNGRTWILPGDVPIATVMRHQALVDAGAITSADADTIYSDVLELFRHKKPTLDRIELSRSQLLLLIRTVYVANSSRTEPISLDDLGDPQPKRVRLDGKTYELPSDLPADLWLRINRFTVEQHTDTTVVAELYERVLELFRIADPKLPALEIGVGTLLRAINRIYNTPAEPDAAVPPPRRRSRAATTGKAKGGAARSTQRKASA